MILNLFRDLISKIHNSFFYKDKSAVNLEKEYFYVFALKWSPDKKEYNIHGLWPKYNKCNPIPSDPKEFKDVILNNKDLFTELKNSWNSDLHSKNASSQDLLQSDLQFWAHEWYKHGSRSGLTEIQYFKLVLDLYNHLKTIIPTFFKSDEIYYYLDQDFNMITSEPHADRYHSDINS